MVMPWANNHEEKANETWRVRDSGSEGTPDLPDFDDSMTPLGGPLYRDRCSPSDKNFPTRIHPWFHRSTLTQETGDITGGSQAPSTCWDGGAPSPRLTGLLETPGEPGAPPTPTLKEACPVFNYIGNYSCAAYLSRKALHFDYLVYWLFLFCASWRIWIRLNFKMGVVCQQHKFIFVSPFASTLG